MPEDRSLDEFAGGPSDDGAEDAENDEDVEDDEGDDGNDADGVVSDDDVAPAEGGETGPVATDDVDPATTTSAWASDGGRCERCGDTVRRLWGADETLVCPDCKKW